MCLLASSRRSYTAVPAAVTARTRAMARVRRGLLKQRRLLAASALAAAIPAGLAAVAPDAEQTRSVVVASHDVAGGQRLEPGDLRVVSIPSGAIPDGAFAEPGGSSAGSLLPPSGAARP
jgi:Flp pilus assembly protein CpaB